MTPELAAYNDSRKVTRLSMGAVVTLGGMTAKEFVSLEDAIVERLQSPHEWKVAAAQADIELLWRGYE